MFLINQNFGSFPKPCGIFGVDSVVAIHFMILKPALVLIDAPDGVISPPLIPVAAHDEYPTSSTLKVFLFPPAFQHHAT